ncbi:MAG: hypothetical protein ACQESE_00580 [Nanobdellota archaeon]
MNSNSDSSTLTIGVLHSRVGFVDGVSVVIDQMVNSLSRNMNVQPTNMFYLCGKSGFSNSRVTEWEPFDFEHPLNKFIENNYENELPNDTKEELDEMIGKGEQLIAEFIEKNNIDVIIAHNTCYPVNFILAKSLSSYYEHNDDEKTPPYILWWHDSHLERQSFTNPQEWIKEQIISGVPGPYVDHIVFINSIQPKIARDYFAEVEEKLHFPGLVHHFDNSHTIIYNTTDIFISDYSELDSEIVKEKKKRFFEEFSVDEQLASKDVQKPLFVLQQTRMVERKRIDFALEYSFKLLEEIEREGLYDGIYFFISGNDTNNLKERLISKYEELKQRYSTDKVIIDFAKDHSRQTDMDFLDYPVIFAHLRGLTTYFSEVEGFGNNLLEVLAAGLIPVIYKYPVFKTDIEQFKFNVIDTEEFVISEDLISQSKLLLENEHFRKQLANGNLKILREHFSHRIIAEKMKNILSSIESRNKMETIQNS